MNNQREAFQIVFHSCGMTFYLSLGQNFAKRKIDTVYFYPDCLDIDGYCSDFVRFHD